MALDRWQQQLCDLLAAVHIKQQQYDLASTACQVLLKPWPKKSQKSESRDKNDVPDAADLQVHSHEEAELKVVNDVLKRAQKTRVKTTSKKLKEHVVPVDDPVSSRSGRELWEICDSEPQTVQESVLKGDAQSSKSKPVSMTKTNESSTKNISSAPDERSTKTAVNKQQQRNQPARQSGDQSSRSVSKHHLSLSSTTKPSSNGDLQRPKSLESLGSSRRPSRPRSARGNFKPAHTTAPFKTDPRLHGPKRSVKSSIHPVKQQPAGKCQNYAGDRNYANRVLPPIGSEKDRPPSSASDIQEDSVLKDACDIGLVPASGESQPKVHDQIRSDHEETLNNCLSSLTVESNTAQDVSGQQSGVGVDAPFPEGSTSQPEEKQEAKLFSLLSDGSRLNIPPKMRRAFAKNQQRRKKVSQRDAARKSESEERNMGLKFAEKLQQLFDPEEELLYRQQALECLHTHQQLLLLLTQLDLDHLTEASSAEEILRAKTLAEFVLASFSELSEEVNFFSKVQFPDTPNVKQPSHKEVRHPYLWLPASLQGENLSAAQKLHYSSKTDLNQYMNVLLRLQTLQCQHHLLDILISDILPWLQQQDCNQKDFGVVFRGLFALLASDGSRLPVLICDSVQ